MANIGYVKTTKKDVGEAVIDIDGEDGLQIIIGLIGLIDKIQSISSYLLLIRWITIYIE